MSTLTEARARLAAITPGPWATSNGDWSVFTADDSCTPIAYIGLNKKSRTEQNATNMRFIAHAPADLAAAFARIAALEAALRPFAEALQIEVEFGSDGLTHIGIPISDCRRAAELLKEGT